MGPRRCLRKSVLIRHPHSWGPGGGIESDIARPTRREDYEQTEGGQGEIQRGRRGEREREGELREIERTNTRKKQRERERDKKQSTACRAVFACAVGAVLEP